MSWRATPAAPRGAPCPSSPQASHAKPTLNVRQFARCPRARSLALWLCDCSCAYVVQMRSKYGCGCAPLCSGNCGPSNCPGIMCGPPGLAGQCPPAQSCISDTWGVNYCCAPDCRGRMCGGDGCGGNCGYCSGGQECSRNQQCVSVRASQSPAPVTNVVTKYTTTSSDVFASFMGGVLSAGVGTMGLSYFRRVRQGMQAPLLANAV